MGFIYEKYFFIGGFKANVYRNRRGFRVMFCELTGMRIILELDEKLDRNLVLI